MRCGVYVPNVGSYGDPRTIVSIARDAEQAGWDGVFLWDVIAGEERWNNPWICDPWVALSAIACVTERIRIGTIVTPLARRRPWKVARETASVDRLSGGRLTLGVGLGEPASEFASFGEDVDARTRGRKLDEALDVLTGLWSGKPFAYHGDFYSVDGVTFKPPPRQNRRIPIWIGGQWPNRTPIRRAARYDGICPAKSHGRERLTTAELRALVAMVSEYRISSEPFDVVVSGHAEKDGTARGCPSVGEYADAGATWWLTEIDDWWGSVEEMRERVQAGPPDV
jgi:probable F420-dependent oxidoreductase